MLNRNTLHTILRPQDFSTSDCSDGKGVGQQTGELPKGDAEKYPGLRRGRLLHSPERMSVATRGPLTSQGHVNTVALSQSQPRRLCATGTAFSAPQLKHLWMDLGIKRNVTNACSRSTKRSSSVPSRTRSDTSGGEPSTET